MSLELQSRYDLEPVTQDRFAVYHAANPQVYNKLREYALQYVRSGRRRLSINMLFELVRWFTEVETRGSSFKLDNSFRAPYARLLMENEPELLGRFKTRKTKADAA